VKSQKDLIFFLLLQIDFEKKELQLTVDYDPKLFYGLHEKKKKRKIQLSLSKDLKLKECFVMPSSGRL